LHIFLILDEAFSCVVALVNDFLLLHELLDQVFALGVNLSGLGKGLNSVAQAKNIGAALHTGELAGGIQDD